MDDAEVSQLLAERDGYKLGYETLSAEFGAIQAERDGYKLGYEKLSAEVGAIQAERDGYKLGYEKLSAEVGAIQGERAGYKLGYEEFSVRAGYLTSEREGYRKAYLSISEQIASARALSDRYRELFEKCAADRFRPVPVEEGRHLNPDTAAFLIISNGRTGSTWLNTTADRLPDVIAQREVNWLPPGLPDRPISYGIDGTTTSMRQAIAGVNSLSGEAVAIAGSKLVFDLYGYLGPEVFERLSAIMEPDIKIIALRRSYMEWWLSWKVRGVHHELDEDVFREMSKERNLGYLTGLERPPIRNIVLTVDGKPLAEPDSVGTLLYPFRDAVDDMLVALTNDAACEAIAKARDGMLLDYSEIVPRFPEIARFIGSTASNAEIEAAGSSPLTRKLETLSPSLVTPTDILPELSEILARCRSLPIRWLQRDLLEIESGELADFLTRFGIGASDSEARPGVVQWRIRRPIYPL